MTKIDESLRELMTYAQAMQSDYANRHRQHAPKYAVGDLVWLDARNLSIDRPNKKLSNKFEGLFPITDINSSYSYRLELPSSWSCHPVFHTSLLRPYPNDPIPGQLPPAPFPLVDDDGNDVWEVDAILASKFSNSRLKFLV